MTPKKKTLSNPFSTGGGGVHFEAHVQASFVALMLTGGHAPCLPCWPIKEIKLQGKINGIDTDDLVVVVENIHSKEQRKLLGQIKHSISITKGNILFGQVIHDAWSDFNNPKLFTRNKDIIALITGPLSANDAHNVLWLLNQARHTKNTNEFFRNVQQVKFSPPKSSEKLEVIQYHLNSANGGKDVSRDEIYEFLNHFHLLGYDVGNEFGVVLSLLHSHISQFQLNEPKWVWSRVVDIVQTWNQDAGTITPSKLPEDLLEAFKQRAISEIPSEFKALQENHKMDWNNHSDATYLALAILIGSWQDKSQCDVEVITQLLGINYDEWLKKAREILQYQDSPLSFRNGIWKIVNRTELWKLLGSRILDQNIDTFRSLAISVLQEPDPAFILSPEERYAASINGKAQNCSTVIRKGIAEGLAILGSQHESCIHSSKGKAELTCVLVLRELLTDADWILWGSLNSLLPTLAEAAPIEFLDAVEKAMLRSPCPFDDLFYQEGNSITGSNYLTGLLWALECLAWDEQYLVRVCLVLGELDRHDPGGHWFNRPSNSLSTILLPWLPQTLASVDKRKVAVQTILREWPDVAWNLIIQLLPGKHQTSFETYKPNWRKIIPDNWRKGVTQQEYWEQSSYYTALAVDVAGQDTARLSELIDHFDILPETAFNKLLQSLASMSTLELPEEQRLLIWDHLTKFTNKHRRNSNEKWAFPDEIITRIENVAEHLAPTDPINLYQYLFADRDFELYEENGNWEEQRKELEIRREKGISEVIQQAGIKGVIRFAESVSKPVQVGFAFGLIADTIGEQTLLPAFLDSEDNKRKDLVNGFIWRRYLIKGWEWCDNLDKSGWKLGQIGQFLAYLPFSKETWDRALKWLQSNESEYWTRTSVNVYHAGDDLKFAIEKLLEHGRPHAAINCLDQMHHGKWPIDSNQCIRALLEAPSSNESFTNFDRYNIIELIKFLQAEPSVNEDDLFKVEWAYLPLLDRHNGVAPKILESRLAGDPEFFCTLIKLIYRPNKVDQPLRKLSEGSKAIAKNAWRLLHEWNTPPGTQKDGMFSDVQFINWLQRVKEVCLESGHLEFALINIGEVLIHTPPDSDGLWINRTVATALNDREANDMRDGFFTGSYNSRGVHWVDPTGKPEREHAEQFRRKAEELENAGFHRFCVTLKKLANTYDREAERIVSDHEQMGDD